MDPDLSFLLDDGSGPPPGGAPDGAARARRRGAARRARRNLSAAGVALAVLLAGTVLVVSRPAGTQVETAATTTAGRALPGTTSTEQAPIPEAVKSAGRGILIVRTLDREGNESVGTAFPVMSDERETLLVTSYEVVSANVAKPGPPMGIQLLDDGTAFEAELWATDPARDLALILVERGGFAILPWASDEVMTRLPGQRIFALSALGGAGDAVSPGIVADLSSAGIRSTAVIGEDFRGGPIVMADGTVVGVATRAYGPAQPEPVEARFAPNVRAICERLLACAAGVRDRKDKDVEAGGAPESIPTSTSNATTAALGSPVAAATSDGPLLDTRGWQFVQFDGVSMKVPPSWPVIDMADTPAQIRPSDCNWHHPTDTVLLGVSQLRKGCGPPGGPPPDLADGAWIVPMTELVMAAYSRDITIAGKPVRIDDFDTAVQKVTVLITNGAVTNPSVVVVWVGPDPTIARTIIHSITLGP